MGIIFIITCVYGILSSEIRQVVVEDTGFYVYKHSVKNLDSQWYNFDYLKTHNIQLLDGEVYFCEVKTNNAGWNRESFKGVESDNICKLVDDWTLGRILNITYMIILLNNQKKELVIAYLKNRMVKLFF